MAVVTGDIKKMQVKIDAFEQAAVGEKVKETLVDCLAYLNILHSKKFGTEAKNE